MHSSVALLYTSLSLVAAGPILTPRTSAYNCFDFQVPMSFPAISLKPSFPPFQNHYESVALLERLTSRNRSEYPPPIVGAQNVSVEVTVAAQYCSPRQNPNGIVQVLTHGLGFDRSYWDFGGEKSQYNYIRVATGAGYSTLSYDRIGNGQSTKSDPYTINQLGIQAQVLAILTTHLRNRDIPALQHIPQPHKIVHVGHSYGSELSVALVSNNPTLSDGLILTGFAENSTSGLIVSSNFHLARETSRRFANLSSGYLTWGDELSNQYSFLHWPEFSPSILGQAERNKSPFAIGEILTSTATPTASRFTGPVLVSVGSEFARASVRLIVSSDYNWPV